MSKRSPEAQARLKANYAALRAAGLSPLEASRLRSASQAKVNAAIATGARPTPLSERHRAAGGGHTWKTPAPTAGPYGTHKGRIKNDDYKEVYPGEGVIYHAKYAYLMTYVTETKDGIQDRKYYTILSDKKLTKSQLKDEVYQNCQNTNGSYEAKVNKNSIELITAFHNPDFD